MPIKTENNVVDRITEALFCAMVQNKHTFRADSKSIAGKEVWFFDYSQSGDITGDKLRGAALYRHSNGSYASNQYGPLVFDSYQERLRRGDF